MISLRNWMSQSNLGSTTVAQICFPATHDSGTYGLTDELTPAGVQLVQDFIKEVVKKLEDDGNLPPGFVVPLEAVWDVATAAAFGLAKTTNRTIAEQLDQGIRCLDLRISYNAQSKPPGYYVHHTLYGPALADVLSDLQSFLASTNGEIVYVTFTGFRNFDVGGPDQQTLFDGLAEQVIDSVGTYALTPGDCSPALFEMRYDRITDSSKPSRVILAMGEDAEFSNQEYASYFFDTLYCPPNEKREKGVIAGEYTNTTSPTDALATQQAQLKSDLSWTPHLPFALYMTLTPSPLDYVAIIGASVVEVLTGFGAFGSNIVELAYRTSGWWTLEQLSAKLNAALDKNVADVIYGAVEASGITPAKPTKNNPPRTPITFLYVDWFENTNVVNLAMDLTGGHVYTWQGDKQLQFAGNGGNPSSFGAPASAAIDDQLYLGYLQKGNSPYPIELSMLTGTTNEWTAPETLTTTDGTMQTSALGLAMASWLKTPDPASGNEVGDPALYVVYPDSGGVPMMVVLSDASDVASCNTPKTIEDITNTTPSVTVFNDLLVVAYTNQSNQICTAWWDRLNQKWGNHGAIQNSANTYAITNQSPAICAYGDQLVLVYQTSSKQLFWATAPSPSGPWTGMTAISVSAPKPALPFKSDTGTPASAAAPGIGIFRGLLYLIYRGAKHNNLLLSIYNGYHWVGNQTLSSIASNKVVPTANFAPESIGQPSLATVGDTLSVLYEDENGKTIKGLVLEPVPLPVV